MEAQLKKVANPQRSSEGLGTVNNTAVNAPIARVMPMHCLSPDNAH